MYERCKIAVFIQLHDKSLAHRKLEFGVKYGHSTHLRHMRRRITVNVRDHVVIMAYGSAVSHSLSFFLIEPLAVFITLQLGICLMMSQFEVNQQSGLYPRDYICFRRAYMLSLYGTERELLVSENS